MKKFLNILLLSFIVILFFTSCENNTFPDKNKNDLLGVYVLYDFDKNDISIPIPYIQLKKDDVFVFSSISNNNIIGKYKVNKNIIELKSDDGAIYNFKFEDEKLIFENEPDNKIGTTVLNYPDTEKTPKKNGSIDLKSEPLSKNHIFYKKTIDIGNINDIKNITIQRKSSINSYISDIEVININDKNSIDFIINVLLKEVGYEKLIDSKNYVDDFKYSITLSYKDDSLKNDKIYIYEGSNFDMIKYNDQRYILLGYNPGEINDYFNKCKTLSK